MVLARRAPGHPGLAEHRRRDGHARRRRPHAPHRGDRTAETAGVVVAELRERYADDDGAFGFFGFAAPPSPSARLAIPVLRQALEGFAYRERGPLEMALPQPHDEGRQSVLVEHHPHDAAERLLRRWRASVGPETRVRDYERLSLAALDAVYSLRA